MSDITEVFEQDQVANSLLSESDQAALQAEQQGVDFDREAYGPTDRGEGMEEFEGQEGADAELNELAEYAQQQELQQQEEELESQQEWQQEPTPQEVQAGLRELDEVVTELQLNDPSEAALLASSLGVDPASSAGLGQVMGKVTLSAFNVFQQAGGDLSKVGPVTGEGAVAFKNEFERSVLGIDPRTSPADPQQLASLMMYGTLSVIDAFNRYGLDASMDVINSAESSQWFADRLLQIYGNNQPANRNAALEQADAFARHVGSVLTKYLAQQEQQPRSRTSSGTRRASASRPQSDEEFWQGAAEAYKEYHGRL